MAEIRIQAPSAYAQHSFRMDSCGTNHRCNSFFESSSLVRMAGAWDLMAADHSIWLLSSGEP